MKRAALLFVPAAALLLAACAGAPPAVPPAVPGAAAPPPPAPVPPEATPAPPAAPPFSALAARFTERALRQEKAGELRQALDSWKVVAALRPETAEPKRRLSDLGARVAAEAARHYAEGTARLRDGDIDAARRELLLALAADPGHAAALDTLKNRLEPLAASHTVAAGETFEEIAKRYYGDPAKAPLIARVNNLDPAGRPAVGAVIVVPTLAPAPTKTAPAARRPAPAAEPEATPDTGYDTEPAAIDHELPPSPASPIVEPAPPSLPAPAPAVPAASPAAPRLPDPAEQQRTREKAEAAYTAGVRFFINQQLDEAIRSWEVTLSLNPEHPKAAKDIEKARALQQKLKDIR